MPDDKLTLYIGNKVYSSWSLRGWLPLKLAGAAFEEVVLPLPGMNPPPDSKERKVLQQLSPFGRVPLLKHGELLVWDSLAICEYIAELYPAANLWPKERGARAVARSVSAEMHSGFPALRTQMCMDVRREPLPLLPGPDTALDIERILKIWRDCRAHFGSSGPFLFGERTIADIMFAPVVTRFRTYAVEVDDNARGYMKTIFDLPAMREWIDAAQKETWVIDSYSNPRK